MKKERFIEIVEKYGISDEDSRDLLTLRESEDVDSEWRKRYEELHRKYIDTFFGGQEKREEIFEERKENDSADITIEELRERLKEEE